jgi:hypothetical protein
MTDTSRTYGSRYGREQPIPGYVRALAIIDEEAPTSTQLRAYIDSGVRVSGLVDRGWVTTFPGRTSQNKACARLCLTDEGRAELRGILDVYARFVRGDDLAEIDDLDDEEVTDDYLPVLDAAARGLGRPA